MDYSRTITAILLSSAAMTLSVKAGPPLITDDPDTPGPNHWEINLAATMEKFDSDWGWELPLVDINYGLGERIQLKFEIPWNLVDENGQELKSGLGNSELGIKWRFLDQENSGIAMSVYPQFTFNSLQRSIDRGIVDDGSEFVLPLQISRTFGDAFVYAEVGYAWLEHGSNEWGYGIAVEYETSETFKLLGEIHGVAEQDFQQDELLFNLGFKWHFHENVTLMGSAGRSLREPKGEEEFIISYLGFQFTF